MGRLREFWKRQRTAQRICLVGALLPAAGALLLGPVQYALNPRIKVTVAHERFRLELGIAKANRAFLRQGYTEAEERAWERLVDQLFVQVATAAPDPWGHQWQSHSQGSYSPGPNGVAESRAGDDVRPYPAVQWRWRIAYVEAMPYRAYHDAAPQIAVVSGVALACWAWFVALHALLSCNLAKEVVRACVLASPLAVIAFAQTSLGAGSPTLLVPPSVAVAGSVWLACVLAIVWKRQQRLKRPVLE